MTRPSCPEVREQLPLFVGGDIDAGTAEGVRVHLIACLSCRNEASALQHAGASLRDAAAQPVAGVDEAFFASMHRTILARVEAAEAVPAGGVRRRWGLGAAAAALVACGFWWGTRQEGSSVWDRAPLATPAAVAGPMVVPWSGPRAPLRLLGNDRAWDADEGMHGAGMLGRDELRILVDEGMVLPPRRDGRR